MTQISGHALGSLTSMGLPVIYYYIMPSFSFTFQLKTKIFLKIKLQYKCATELNFNFSPFICGVGQFSNVFIGKVRHMANQPIRHGHSHNHFIVM